MRTSILNLLLTVILGQNVVLSQIGVTYNINGDNHEVQSQRYGYSFHWPKKWWIASNTGGPYFFNYSHHYFDAHGVRLGVPKGGAEIGIISDAQSHDAGSIDKWMELDRTAHGFSSTRELQLPPETTIRRAVEAVSFHDDGDSRHKKITRTTAIYFEFQGGILAAFLRYNANDPKGVEYEKTLIAVVQSFRPLTGVDHSK